MNNKKRRNRGFSLIEMVIVIGLISVLTTLVSVFLSQSLKSYRFKNQSVALEENAASVMREFEQSARAATEILIADKNELKFYRFYDLNSPEPKQVRYFIDDNKFKVGITNPVGISPNISYPSSNEVITLLIENVVNTDHLFDYFDGLGNDLSFPVNINSIRMAQLVITLDKDITKPPAEITETTKITFRNLKDNL